VLEALTAALKACEPPAQQAAKPGKAVDRIRQEIEDYQVTMARRPAELAALQASRDTLAEEFRLACEKLDQEVAGVESAHEHCQKMLVESELRLQEALSVLNNTAGAATAEAPAPAPAPAPVPPDTATLLHFMTALLDLIPPEGKQRIPPELSEFLKRQTAPPAADNAAQEESKWADVQDDPIGDLTQRERDLSPHQPARGKLRQAPKAHQTAEEATAVRAAAAQLAKKTEAAMRLEETRAKAASEAGGEPPFEGPLEAPENA
jgi:hypothetical protein